MLWIILLSNQTLFIRADTLFVPNSSKNHYFDGEIKLGFFVFFSVFWFRNPLVAQLATLGIQLAILVVRVRPVGHPGCPVGHPVVVQLIATLWCVVGQLATLWLSSWPPCGCPAGHPVVVQLATLWLPSFLFVFGWPPWFLPSWPPCGCPVGHPVIAQLAAL